MSNALIDISCQHGAQQQTPFAVRMAKARPLHRPCSAYYAGNINKHDQRPPLTANVGQSVQNLEV